MPSNICHRNPPQPFVQMTCTISKAPPMMARSPMMKALIRVANAMSPRTTTPARNRTRPSKTRTKVDAGDSSLSKDVEQSLSPILIPLIPKRESRSIGDLIAEATLSIAYLVAMTFYLRSPVIRGISHYSVTRAGGEARRPLSRAPPTRASCLEGTQRRAEHDHRYQRDDRADDCDHDDVEVALTVCRTADGKQCHDRAVVRQAVERARADHSNPVQQRGVNALRVRELHVHLAECIERYGETARGRARESRQHIGGDGQ